MPVIWAANVANKATAWDDIGLAVGCGLCLAYAGEPCATTTFPLGRGIRTHQQRHDEAETIGFVLVLDGGAAPPPASRAAETRPAPVMADLFAKD